MKLSEILTEATIFDENELKSTKWESPEELRKWLKSAGFKKLGSGVFSDAWAKPNHKRVVKISLKTDPCWVKYAKWVLKQTANKYLPKIPWIKLYKDKDGTEFFVTIIEKLESYSTANIKKIDDPVVVSALFVNGEFKKPEHAVLSNLLMKKFDIKDLRAARKVVKQNASHKFVKTLNRISTMVSVGQCDHDLHSGNLMYRPSTNSIVIIDPLAGYYD